MSIDTFPESPETQRQKTGVDTEGLKANTIGSKKNRSRKDVQKLLLDDDTSGTFSKRSRAA